jgi:O-antigen/teichoic acid export membrane protein
VLAAARDELGLRSSCPFACDNKMKASHRVVINTGILYARMGITVSLSLYTTRVVLIALGIGDFGIFNLVGGVIAMLTFLNSSMTEATQRFMSFAHGQGNETRQHNIFNVSVMLHAGIALLLIGILEIAGYFLFNGVLQIAPDRMHAAWIVYQCAIASTFFTIISVPYDAVINARENMLLFAVLGVVEAVLKLLIAFAISSTSHDKLVLYGVLFTLLSFILFAFRVIYCSARYFECTLALHRYFDKALFHEMTSFAGWSFLGSSTSILSNYGQGIVLNMFFGTVVNAAQGISNQVSGQLGAFAGTMLRALNPLIAKSEGAGDRAMMLKATLMGSKVSFFLLMLFYVPMLVEMPYIFEIWLKNVPDYAVIFCRLLLLRNLINQLYATLISSISAVGKIREYQISMSLLNLLPLVLSYILFSMGMEPYFLYLSFLAYSVGEFILVLVFSKLKFSMSIRSYLEDVVVRCSAAFLICLGASCLPLLFMGQGLGRLLAVLTLCLISYIPSVWFVIFSSDDRYSVLRIVASLFSAIKTRISNKRLGGI